MVEIFLVFALQQCLDLVCNFYILQTKSIFFHIVRKIFYIYIFLNLRWQNLIRNVIEYDYLYMKLGGALYTDKDKRKYACRIYSLGRRICGKALCKLRFAQWETHYA